MMLQRPQSIIVLAGVHALSELKVAVEIVAENGDRLLVVYGPACLPSAAPRSSRRARFSRNIRFLRRSGPVSLTANPLMALMMSVTMESLVFSALVPRASRALRLVQRCTWSAM